MLEVVAGDGVELAAEVVGRALARSDPQAAALIMAGAARLRGNGDAAREAESALLSAMAARQPGYRAQISLYDLFDEQVTLLHGGPCDHVWAYDEDIVGLVDGIGADLPPAQRAALLRDPWAWNTVAAAQLGRLLDGSAARRIGSVRLMSFEGVRRFGAVVGDRDAARLVTHLALQEDHRADDRSVGAAFPNLRGLAVDEGSLASVLRDGAPELRSLVVRGTSDIAATLDAAAGLPSLRHLGLWYGALGPAEVERVAASEVMARLVSLELFTIDDAVRFPFDLVVAIEPFRRLQRIGLPGHLVGDEVRSLLVDRPEIDLVSHDRRERIAFDIETIGWAEHMR